MEAVTKALKAARDAYDSTGELSRKTRSALVEMRHEAYKSAAEIVDATWRLLTRDGWRIEMRNPQSKKSEARYVNPQSLTSQRCRPSISGRWPQPQPLIAAISARSSRTQKSSLTQ